MDAPKRFRLLDDATFQRLSQAQKVEYLAKALETIRRESKTVGVVDSNWGAKTVPLPDRKPR